MTESFDGFCEAEWPRLVGALGLYCGDRGVAEELAQDALLRVLPRWDEVRLMSSPGAFAYRVAINLANSRWRRRTAELRARKRVIQEGGARAPDFTDEVAVRELVAALPHRQRAALILRYWVGLSAPDAARVLNISPGALRALTHRAVEALRDEVGAIATRPEAISHER